MKFTDLQIAPEILQGIEGAGFTQCTPVQWETYTHGFLGRDVCVQSQTGTGKTAAFLITIYKLFTENMVPNKKALILVPTRELAVQIEAEGNLLGKYLPYTYATFFGGVGYAPQEKALENGVDIMIATPGRFIDLYKSGKVNLKDVSVLVIDEADRMFDMGFIPDIRYIVKKMPPATERKTMLFSATLSQKVKGLAWEYMNDPKEIEIFSEQVTVDRITQALYHVGSDEKMRLLLGILKKYNPQNAIIFTNMKHTAESVSKRLTINGYANEYIMGDLPQKKRQKVIDGVKSGEIKFLVATDVAARGLHVDDLDMVINYDIPEDCENYVHRIGRTARAGKSGVAISLACEKFVKGLEAIEKYIDMKIPVEWFEDDMLVKDESAGMRIERDISRGDRSQRRDGRRGEKPSDRKRDTRRPQSSDTHRSKRRGHPGDVPRESSSGQNVRKHADNRPKRTDGFPQQKKIHSGPQSHNDPRKSQTKIRSEFSKKKITPRRDGSLEERVSYYRQKYGDNFTITEEMIRDDRTRKKSFWQRIKSVFGKN